MEARGRAGGLEGGGRVKNCTVPLPSLPAEWTEMDSSWSFCRDQRLLPEIGSEHPNMFRSNLGDWAPQDWAPPLVVTDIYYTTNRTFIFLQCTSNTIFSVNYHQKSKHKICPALNVYFKSSNIFPKTVFSVCAHCSCIHVCAHLRAHVCLVASTLQIHLVSEGQKWNSST